MALTFSEILTKLENGDIQIDQALNQLQGTVTSEDAKKLLNYIEVGDKASLTGLIGKLDVIGNGKTKTLFYSGDDALKNAVESLKNEFRTIHNTEAFKFLTSTAFDTRAAEIITDADELDNFINKDIGQGGAWDTVSKNFAKETTGEAIALVGKGGKVNRIFVQTELPELLQNANVTKMNGYDKSVLNLFSDDVTRINFFKVDTIIKRAKVNGVAVEVAKVTYAEAQDFMKDPANRDKVADIRKEIKDISFNLDYSKPTYMQKLAFYFNKLGPLGTGIGFLVAANYVEKLYASGNVEGAKLAAMHWGAEEAGAILGGTAGAIAASLVFAIAGTVSAPVAAAITVLAALTGAIVGPDVAKGLLNKWFNDSTAEDFKLALFTSLAKFQYIDTGGSYAIVTYDSAADRWNFPPGYDFEYLQDEGADGFAAVLKVLLDLGRTPFNLPNVTMGFEDYGHVRYFDMPTASSMRATFMVNHDEALIEQILYARPFGFDGYSHNDKNYSLEFHEYSRRYFEKKIDLFVNSVYDSQWYQYLGFLGYDAHYVDVDANVNVGVDFIQNKVFFGGNQTSDEVYGSAFHGDDHLFGNGGDDKLHGEGGHDYIEGGLGSDTIDGGSGNDIIFTNTDVDAQFDKDAGINYVLGGSGDDKITGSKVVDIIYGEDDDDTIKGKGGGDRLYGEAGEDTIHGGKGDDVIYTDFEDTALSGNTAKNTAYGDENNDTLHGGTAKDYLYGGDDVDELHGYDNDDKLVGGDHNDTIRGGEGDDEIYVDFEDPTRSSNATNNVAFGEKGDDTLIGGTAGDDLYGGDDDDYLYGFGAADKLVGGDGNDEIGGGEGDDVIFTDFEDPAQSGSATKNVAFGEGGSDSMIGGTVRDEMDGGDDVDYIYGFGGNDLLIGGDHNDEIYGGGGSDTIFTDFQNLSQSSNATKNVAYGEANVDFMFGGSAKDELYGGDGDRIIVASDNVYGVGSDLKVNAKAA